MEFHSGYTARERDISALFRSTFSASESADEGALVERLAIDLMEKTQPDDLVVWSAYDGQLLLGCIFFSRLTFAQDHRTVFILSPVAVRTDRQRTGIGQRLIAHGLDDLRQRGVDLVMTYGDPNYYAKTGFRQITEAFAKAPLKLSYPKGWLCQSLLGKDEQPLTGASACVAALNRSALW